jgi:hypothetical protein
MAEERNPLKVFGRVIGTYTGWEQVDDLTFMFYDFIPDEKYDLKAGDLAVDYESGSFQVTTDDEYVQGGDLLPILANPKA